MALSSTRADAAKTLFQLDEGFGMRGGLIVQIGTGTKEANGATSSIYVRDDAFSFIEPILKRRVANYHPYARWGVTEIQADAWLPVVADLKSLAARLAAGEALSSADIAWVHTVDEDNGIETDADMFRQQVGNGESLAALRAFLERVAEWVEDSLQQEAVLTIYGI